MDCVLLPGYKSVRKKNEKMYKIRSDDSLHMPDDSHDTHTHSNISFFKAYQNELSDLSLLLENQNQSLRNAFSLPFHTQHPVCETGGKIMAILKHLFITCCHGKRQK